MILNSGLTIDNMRVELMLIITVFQLVTSTPYSSYNNLCTERNYQTFLSHPNDCQKFIRCIDGVVITYKCPNRSYFNQRDQICEYNSSVCRMAYYPFAGLCNNYSSGRRIPHPLDWHKYIICGLLPEERICGENWIFDHTIRTCRPTDNVNYSDICYSKPDYSKVPHMTDCSKYFECLAEIPRPKQCPGGLYFDMNTDMCNLRTHSRCFY